MAELFFAVPGGVDLPTGGATYDRKVAGALRSLGWRVEVLDWPGGFPSPDAAARTAVAASLAALPDDSVVLVDGLALGALPELAREQSARLRLVALVHHPLALETGLPPEAAARLAMEEREALRWVRAVIVTSATTAATLEESFGVPRERITVAVPGIESRHARPRSPGPLRILSVGHITPRKAHSVLVAALAGVADRDFLCTIAGDAERDPATAAALTAQIAALGLSERVRLAGAVGDEALADLYAQADLFALASRYEGYGMAIAEALAWGVPVVATTGGAIPEVVPSDAGMLVAPGDPGAFAEALRALLSDAGLRAGLAANARRAAADLGGWDATAACVAAALDSVASPSAPASR